MLQPPFIQSLQTSTYRKAHNLQGTGERKYAKGDERNLPHVAGGVLLQSVQGGRRLEAQVPDCKAAATAATGTEVRPAGVHV